jgi:hypothetical protein
VETPSEHASSRVYASTSTVAMRPDKAAGPAANILCLHTARKSSHQKLEQQLPLLRPSPIDIAPGEYTVPRTGTLFLNYCSPYLHYPTLSVDSRVIGARKGTPNHAIIISLDNALDNSVRTTHTCEGSNCNQEPVYCPDRLLHNSASLPVRVIMQPQPARKHDR